MKWTLILLLISLCFVHGLSPKKLLLVGPEGSSLIHKYCTVTSTDISPLQEYPCTINGEQVILITTPAYNGKEELEDGLKRIGTVESLNSVIFLWPNPSESFFPYVPPSLFFIPYVKGDQNPFVLIVSNSDLTCQDFQKAMGINNVEYGKSWEVLDNWVKKIDPSVFVKLGDPNKDKKRKFGCLASLNVVETPKGQKLVKDVEVGDEVLTPRGYMPIIYVEDHPNITFPCVHYGGVWLTEDHFIYNQDKMVAAGELTNATMKVQLEVRTIVVKGDSFFCHHVLVSSYSRFSWLPSLSFVFDYMPTSLIGAVRTVTSLFL